MRDTFEVLILSMRQEKYFNSKTDSQLAFNTLSKSI